MLIGLSSTTVDYSVCPVDSGVAEQHCCVECSVGVGRMTDVHVKAQIH